MANEDKKIPSDEKDLPADAEPMPEGLTADQAVEAAYNEEEAWEKSKKPLLYGAIAVLLSVGGIMLFKHFEDEKAINRSLRYLQASSEMEGAEERFLAFSGDYQDSLGGLAQYQAAIVQYRDKRYTEAARNFKTAAERLKDSPLRGRVLLGYAVSLIKGGEDLEVGKKALQSLSENSSVLPTDRAEARFLLALQAIADDDEETYAKQSQILAADENSSYFFSRLEELKRTKNFLKVAKSLPDINSDIGAKFLADNKDKEGVKELESGLQYKVLKDGNGTVSPKETDEVEVHYRGTLINGEVFDSSIDRGEPFRFRVNGRVIKGWTEAFQLMKEGDKWKLFIPSAIAYGENGSNSIGPNETLIFEVELLRIIPEEKPQPIEENNASLQQNLGLAPDSNGSGVIAESNATENIEVNASK